MNVSGTTQYVADLALTRQAGRATDQNVHAVHQYLRAKLHGGELAAVQVREARDTMDVIGMADDGKDGFLTIVTIMEEV